jgi:hypothetical protein
MVARPRVTDMFILILDVVLSLMGNRVTLFWSLERLLQVASAVFLALLSEPAYNSTDTKDPSPKVER